MKLVRKMQTKLKKNALGKALFLKYYIIDALKGLYPSVELGKRDYSKEKARYKVPKNYVCKNCSSCPYRKWELQTSVYNGR